MHPRNKRSKKTFEFRHPSGDTENQGRVSVPSRPERRLEGAALVIVLAFLIVITGLVVAFLSDVTNEATATAASASAVTTRTLSDAAIQLVIAQIRDATAGYEHSTNGSLNTNSPVCWASQPGAIRTYDTNASNAAVYKLYSAMNLVDTSGTDNPTSDLPSGGWWTNTAAYVDLNFPVTSGTNINYPILDPYMTNISNGCTIVDGLIINTNTNAGGCYSPSNAAAMPVLWLYMLRNGTIVAPDTNSGTTASFTNAGNLAPSSTNPIVGRIAFWTDDETCKLNINTASEGSYWASPSLSTLMDVNMAVTQPAANEFNRYPGHPASTSLSPVLWTYLGLSNPATFMTALPGNPSNAFNWGVNITSNTLAGSVVTNYYTNLFGNIMPRYYWGGSRAGISNTLLSSNPISTTNLPASRLYSSVDEFFFAATNPLGATNGQTNVMTNFQPLDVSRLRFFLTAESRAPEVNPLNLPKIAMWPVPDTNNTMAANTNATNAASNRTLIDQTIAFCSTLGTNAYYFTRYDATSPTNDIVHANNGRNKILYSYLRQQLDQPQPGFINTGNGGFTSSVKWNALQADQITTLIFDYVRSCINLVDSTGLTNTNGASYTSYNYPYAYTTPPTNTIDVTNQPGFTNFYANLLPGSGQVIPIIISNPDGNITKGIGRFPTVRSGTLWIIARGADQPPVMVYPDRRPIVYASNGVTVLSTNVGNISYIPTANWPLVANGGGYAKINPLHPWTCPQTNASGATMTNLLVPQLMAGSPPFAVFAITNFSAGTTNIMTNLAQQQAVYPIFNLNTNNWTNMAGAPLTRTYPTFNVANNKWIYVTNPAATNGNLYISNNSAQQQVHYYLATNPNIGSAAQNVTHAGLQYLSIQGTNSGAFNIANANYHDSASAPAAPKTTLLPHQTRIEAIFFPELVNVSPGQVGLCASLQIQISGLGSWSMNGNPAGFADPATEIMTNNSGMFDQTSYDLGVETIYGKSLNTTVAQGNFPFFASNAYVGGGLLITPTNTNGTYLSESNSPTMSFSGGNVTITLETTNSSPTVVQQVVMNFPSTTFPAPKLPAYNPIKTSTNTFYKPGNYPPEIAKTSETTTNTNNMGVVTSYSTNTNASDIYFTSLLTFRSGDGNLSTTNNVPFGITSTRLSSLNGNLNASFQNFPRDIVCSSTNINISYAWYTNGMNILCPDTVQSVEALYGDLRLFACLSNVPSGFYATNPYYGQSAQLSMTGWPVWLRNGFSSQNSGYLPSGGVVGFLCPSDANAQSNNYNNVQFWGTNNGQSSALLLTNPTFLSFTVPSGTDARKFMTYYYPYTNSASSGGGDSGFGFLNVYYTTFTPFPFTVPTCDFSNSIFSTIWQRGGDFDNGFGAFPDGPFINKVDEGYGVGNFELTVGATNYQIPYFSDNLGFSANSALPGASLMSANRMVPSPVIFGSLPVGFKQMGSASSPSTNILTNSWLTLQFSPNPNSPATNFLATRSAAAGFNEGGSTITNTIIPDHLILDYFQMPSVEPYPISDPFSCAGKVNMNYQIVPFSHITRDSAMRGVLKNILITAVDETYIGVYKVPASPWGGGNMGSFSNSTYPSGTSYNQLATNSGNFYFYYPVNLSNTLAQFTNRFGSNDIFHSPSEICSIWLYPSMQPTSANLLNNTNALTNNSGASIVYTNGNVNIKNWWYANPGTTRKGLTGDNLRERPYSYIYPRLTTKSNTYQIHYRVQALKQTPIAHTSSYATWIDPAATGITDKVVGEQRGSAVIERYIDPGNTNIPDFAGQISTNGTSAFGQTTNVMDTYYSFRVFNVKKFTP